MTDEGHVLTLESNHFAGKKRNSRREIVIQ